MDLMKQSTAYALLKKKYREFAAPTVRVLVEGSDLGERYHAALSNVSVELTSEYPASGCSFDLLGEYRPPDSDFDSKGALRLLELGAKVEVKLGYIATETVFYGLITGLDYRFDPEEAPVVHVECMDAKCLLMKTQRLEIFREKRIDRAVQALLGEQPVGGYLKGKQVDPVPGEIKMLAAGMETSYDFLVCQARYAGCEFFLLAGKAYFRKRPAAGQPVMTVSPGEALLSAGLSLRGAPLVQKVTVVGIDPQTDREFSGSAQSRGKFGKGAAPSRMLSGTERVYLDAQAESASQAQARAKALLGSIEQGFGTLECRCIGLPELVPGRAVRVKGLSGRMDGSFYVTAVRHAFDETDGYTTTFEARINSL